MGICFQETVIEEELLVTRPEAEPVAADEPGPLAEADPTAEPVTEAEPAAEPIAEVELAVKAEPVQDMETDISLRLCTGPGCLKQALADSVYCGTDCILQHAAATMKTLSGPRMPKSKGRAEKKPAAPRNTAKVSTHVKTINTKVCS